MYKDRWCMHGMHISILDDINCINQKQTLIVQTIYHTQTHTLIPSSNFARQNTYFSTNQLLYFIFYLQIYMFKNKNYFPDHFLKLLG